MLTNAQLDTLKAYINASTDPTIVSLRTSGSTGALADYLNTSSNFVVWRSTTPASDVMNAITWANFTPVDAPDNTATWTNRALACQGKQFNVQTLLMGQQTIASGLANIRQAFQDALTSVPAGVAGALLSAGATAVKTAFQRFATLGEKAFVTGAGTSGSPGNLGWEGFLTDSDVVAALARP